jgi:hypothetical protein
MESGPILATSFDRRSEAYYMNYERGDLQDNLYIKQAARSGVRRARMLHFRAPRFVVRFLVRWRNQEHGGSPNSIIDVGGDVLELEAGFKSTCLDEGWTSKLPDYHQRCWRYVQEHSETFRSWEQFDSLKASVRYFQWLENWNDICACLDDCAYIQFLHVSESLARMCNACACGTHAH